MTASFPPVMRNLPFNEVVVDARTVSVWPGHVETMLNALSHRCSVPSAAPE